jgi:hypothetical protein
MSLFQAAEQARNPVSFRRLAAVRCPRTPSIDASAVRLSKNTAPMQRQGTPLILQPRIRRTAQPRNAHPALGFSLMNVLLQ